MRDAFGRSIFVNDNIVHTFIWNNRPILIWGKVTEVWATGIIMAYNDDRICIENSDTIVILIGEGGVI